jgi:hypothetical protein
MLHVRILIEKMPLQTLHRHDWATACVRGWSVAAACALPSRTLVTWSHCPTYQQSPHVSACYLQEYSDETSTFYWAYGIILGALALLWLAKEAVDFVRVKADNKRIDRAGFEVN